MKITDKDYQELSNSIRGLLSRNITKIEHFKSQGYDFNSERSRWDIFNALDYSTHQKHLYGYLNDTHIDTALKNIIKEIEFLN